MSLALCLSCGNIKAGAFTECEKCGAQSTGNEDLDIQFSDWKLSIENIEFFSNIIQDISNICSNEKIVFWTFLAYISKEHNEILAVEVPSEYQEDVESLLSDIIK